MSHRLKNAQILALCYVVYVSIFSLITALISDPWLPLTQLKFHFGPEIQRILSGHPLEFAHRLPFVPYFLAAVSFLWNEQLHALLIKNLLVQSLLLFVLVNWWRRPGIRYFSAGLFAYVLLFPQVVRHGFALIPEEGYLIALMAFLFHGLLEAPRYTKLVQFLPYALGCGIAYLTKGSMLLLAPVLCVLYYYRSGKTGVLLMFAAFVTAAMLLWGMTTLNNTGHFSLTTVLSGYEIWKGNNPRTLDLYPYASLDDLSAEVPQKRPEENQWNWSKRLRNEAIYFLIDEPVIAVKLFALRFYRAFVSILPVRSPSWADSTYGFLRPTLKNVGIVFMLVFRLLSLASLAYAVVALLRQPGGSNLRSASASYLIFLAAFAAPFLIAFNYETHITPLVFPTILFVLFVLENDGAVRASVGRRMRFTH